MAKANIAEVMKALDMKPGEFRKEWAELADQDKDQIKEGVGNGTMDY